jgi:protein-disulfide isomerase-like protein with CxxC motif
MIVNIRQDLVRAKESFLDTLLIKQIIAKGLKSDPELKKRKAAYKAKYIATQKSKATKAAATLKKNTGLTTKQYYSKLEERRSKMAKKRK